MTPARSAGDCAARQARYARRQKAKGKNDLLARQVGNMANEPIHPLLLPFDFCLLPFAL
jgi:hypothetical protein